MIKHYTDHSANERTYLAWIRTSIAIMAFGFLIEKFDLFIAYLGIKTGDEEHLHSSLSAEVAGVGLFLVGIIIVITATLRFFAYKKAIESTEVISYNVKRASVLLSILIIILALFLLFYMVHKIIG